jgi:tetratricopeptide (TPR) repeat protein
VLGEDPDDFEGMGYLGYAYAEVDSAEKAGQAFAKAIEGLTAKGDKKKIEWAIANRDHFWDPRLQRWVDKIKAGGRLYSDYCGKVASPDEQKLKDEATRNYDLAVASLTRASYYKPGDSKTLGNLGTVYRLRCDYERAESIFSEALKTAPNDKDLMDALHTSRVSRANTMIDAKDYDAAIAMYSRLSTTAATDVGVQSGLADAYFKRAQTWTPATCRRSPRSAEEAGAERRRARPPQGRGLRFAAAHGLQQGRRRLCEVRRG